jgi:hypothetical protein
MLKKMWCSYLLLCFQGRRFLACHYVNSGFTWGSHNFKWPVYIGVLICFSRISDIEDSRLFFMEFIFILNDLHILEFSRGLPVAVTVKTLAWNLNGTPINFKLHGEVSLWQIRCSSTGFDDQNVTSILYCVCTFFKFPVYVFLPSYRVLRRCWTDELRLQFAWRQH